MVEMANFVCDFSSFALELLALAIIIKIELEFKESYKC